MLRALAGEGEIAVLLIEQNLGVAIDVADTVDVMVNGRIAREMPAAELAADRELQQRLLGMRSRRATRSEAPPPAPAERRRRAAECCTVRRAHGDGAPPLDDRRRARCAASTRWNAAARAPVGSRG